MKIDIKNLEAGTVYMLSQKTYCGLGMKGGSKKFGSTKGATCSQYPDSTFDVVRHMPMNNKDGSLTAMFYEVVRLDPKKLSPSSSVKLPAISPSSSGNGSETLLNRSIALLD